MRRLRLSALEVFPTLKRYVDFWPRDPTRLRIGFRPKEDVIDIDQQYQYGLSTLYHDLGVLAFSGCTAAQTERIGSILAKVVALGGAANMAVLLKEPGAVRRTIPSGVPLSLLKEQLNLNFHGNPIHGQISVNTLLQLGDRLTGDTEPFASREPRAIARFLSNKVKARAFTQPSRRGLFLETATGPRLLPLACHVALKAVPGDFIMRSEIWISTIGKGDLVGNVYGGYEVGDQPIGDLSRKQIRALITSHVETQKKGNEKLWQKPPLNGLGPSEAARVVFGDLWALERDIWALRSDASSGLDKSPVKGDPREGSKEPKLGKGKRNFKSQKERETTEVYQETKKRKARGTSAETSTGLGELETVEVTDAFAVKDPSRHDVAASIAESSSKSLASSSREDEMTVEQKREAFKYAIAALRGDGRNST